MSSILKRRHTDREKTQNKFAKRIGFRKNLWKNSTRSLRGGTSTEEKTQSKSAKRISFRKNLRKKWARSVRGGTWTEEKTQNNSAKRIGFRKNLRKNSTRSLRGGTWTEEKTQSKLVNRPYGILVDSSRVIKKALESSCANVIPYESYLCDSLPWDSGELK